MTVCYIDCATCASAFRTNDSRHKFCSEACLKADEKKRWRRVSPCSDTDHSSGTKGAIGELTAAVDLTRRGYHVFRALSPACPFDLVAIRPGRSIKVEVRTGYVSPNGKLCFSRKRHADVDHFAVVVWSERGSEVVYEPPLDSNGAPLDTGEAHSG